MTAKSISSLPHRVCGRQVRFCEARLCWAPKSVVVIWLPYPTLLLQMHLADSRSLSSSGRLLFASFHTKRGDTEMNVEPWQLSDQFGGRLPHVAPLHQKMVLTSENGLDIRS